MTLLVWPLSSPAGITEWETLLPSFDLFSDGKICSAYTDRLEPVPLPHLPFQNIFCPQPALPLLPVSILGGNKEGCIRNSCTHCSQSLVSLIFLATLTHEPVLQIHLKDIFDVVSLLNFQCVLLICYITAAFLVFAGMSKDIVSKNFALTKN